jgi:hypothetical protein
MSQFIFGVGTLFGTATQDAAGVSIASPTPVKFGELQDISADFSRDLKMLYGNNNMPVAVGAGKMKFDFKAKFARISGRVLNDLYFGQTMNSGTLQAIYNDLTGANIPPAAGPYTITPAVPGAGAWQRDLGVVDANGLPMKRVAAGPATGEYSVSAGTYTFAAADAGKLVFTSFQYSTTSAGAKQIVLTQQVMGSAPVFGVDLAVVYGGKQFNWRFPNCTASKLGFSPKQDDFGEVNFEFSAFTDAAGNIGYLVLAE